MSEASNCAKCGACSTVCPVYRVTGNEAHIARGKLHLLDVLGLAESSVEFIDIFSACLLCGACSGVCSRHIDIAKEIVRARAAFSSHAGPHGYEKYLARQVLDSPAGLKALSVLGRAGKKILSPYLPPKSGLRLRLAIFEEEKNPFEVLAERSSSPMSRPLVWFPGCTAQYLSPDITSACKALLADYDFSLVVPANLSCCGLAGWAAGDLEGARANGRKNIRALEEVEGEILVSCASCYAHLQKYPMLFSGDTKWEKRAQQASIRLREMSAFLSVFCKVRPQKAVGRKLRVFYHDPCHMRFAVPEGDKSREVLQGTGRVEIVALPDGARCCGQGGLFHVAYPDISATIRDQLVTDVLALRPDVVTTSCSGCLMQWRQGLAAAGSDVKVLHLAGLLQQLQGK